MADTAADFLEDNPTMGLVILAGSGHVRFGSGIPDRLSVRTGEKTAVILNSEPSGDIVGAGDLLLLAEKQTLPRAGRLGWMINENADGVVVVTDNGRSARLEIDTSKNDRIVRIAGERIHSVEDLRLAMLDRMPGEEVWVELERKLADGFVKRSSKIIQLI